jgi:hypothetical protein
MTEECPGPGCIIRDDGIWCRTHETHHDTNDVIDRECAKVRREAYEDAAKIAEDYAGHKVNWYEAAQDIASAIREKGK